MKRNEQKLNLQGKWPNKAVITKRGQIVEIIPSQDDYIYHGFRIDKHTPIIVELKEEILYCQYIL